MPWLLKKLAKKNRAKRENKKKIHKTDNAPESGIEPGPSRRYALNPTRESYH